MFTRLAIWRFILCISISKLSGWFPLQTCVLSLSLLQLAVCTHTWMYVSSQVESIFMVFVSLWLPRNRHYVSFVFSIFRWYLLPSYNKMCLFLCWCHSTLLTISRFLFIRFFCCFFFAWCFSSFRNGVGREKWFSRHLSVIYKCQYNKNVNTQ